MLYLGNREPSLEEVFDDPIVRLLMERDGLPPDEARACVERVRATLRARSQPSAPAAARATRGVRALSHAPAASLDHLVGAREEG
jgi:hypothetical protein